MSVLKRFEVEGYRCEHGGTYRDPVTNKIRQFDIRAHRIYQRTAELGIAAECKNIGANFPLLVYAVPRRPSEAFHALIRHETKETTGLVTSIAGLVTPTTGLVNGAESRYKPGHLVGKRLDQVGRTPGGDLVGSDQDVFEKVSQSVNSAYDLVQIAAVSRRAVLHAIVPMLVVPDGRLWQVEYSKTGERTGSPHPVETATVFLDHEWMYDRIAGGRDSYRLSHYEISTLGALKYTLQRLWQPTDDTSGLFFVTARRAGLDFSW